MTNTHSAAATAAIITPIAKWYTGKALATILTYVMPTLDRAMADGYWQPGDSRKVRAALNKQAVAAKFAKAQDRDHNYRGAPRSGQLDDVMDNRERSWESTVKGSDFVHAMMFGAVCRAPGLVELGAALVPHCVNGAEDSALATARQWADDFAPIAKLMERLDATRPKPVYVVSEISPLVHANVAQAMKVDFSSIKSPDIEWIWVEMEVKGKLVRQPVGKILWPEGARHNVSRFSSGSAAGNCQCEACGHAIKSGLFVPLLATTPTGPIALWVGRDCARHLFSVDVKGDALFTSGPAAVEA